jgi:hypothetical protein
LKLAKVILKALLLPLNEIDEPKLKTDRLSQPDRNVIVVKPA